MSIITISNTVAAAALLGFTVGTPTVGRAQWQAVQPGAAADYAEAKAYANGDGVRKDEAKAVELYRKAAEKGNRDAMNNLGAMYVNGTGVPKDEAEAAKWFGMAAERGDMMAVSNLAWLALNGANKDPRKALKLYQKAAEGGLAEAQSRLGHIYLWGDAGVKKDEALAAKWLRKAAEQNVAEAQVSLGMVYEHGLGVEANKQEASRWYRKAAEAGNPTGQRALGILYLEGHGVEPDRVQALQWLLLASEQGDIMARKMREELEPAMAAADVVRAKAAANERHAHAKH